MTASEGSVLSARRPFPGLRPFGAGDRDFFFGRDAQIYALYSLLDLSRFVAVVGSSGSGKSSLVRAGLLPVLDEESAADGGRGWTWAEMRPGDAPLEALTRALVGLAGKAAPQDDEALAATRAGRIAYHLNTSSRGIADAIGEMGGIAAKSIILLIDQFEELFRFSAAGADSGRSAREAARSREEAAHFVQLLLEASRSPSADVRIVLTMRSDFIGDCARFQGLPEAVSGTQFLVPALTRDQREAVIRGPIKKAAATIDPELVERLLNDSGEDYDQLPVLQHCLLRLWERAASDAGGARHVSLPEYSEIGGVTGALSLHADEILRNDLPGREVIVAAVFRALSDIDREGRATRRGIPFAQLQAETAAQADDLVAVVDRFRTDDCSFLTPSLTTAPTLQETTRIDVGHEALLRRWEKVSGGPGATGDRGDPRPVGWLKQEREDGRRYQALLAMTDSDDGEPVLLPFDQVERRWQWWTAWPRTEAWALRYGGGHDRVERLLQDSRAAFEADVLRRAEEGQDRRRARITRSAVGVLAVLLVGVIAVGGLFYQQRERAVQTLTSALTFLNRFSDTILSGLNYGTVTSSGARDLITNVEHMIDGITAPTAQTEEIEANILLVMSDVMAVLGDRDEALARARKADELARRLVQTDPGNSAWQLLAFRSAFRIGDAIVHLRLPADYWALALAQFQTARGVAVDLLKTEPENGDFLYNLAFIENKIGEILYLQKDFSGAFARYDAALAIARQIAAMTPPNVSWQIYVPITLLKKAGALAGQPAPDLDGALSSYTEAVQLADDTHKGAPTNDVVISNLAHAHAGRADMLVKRWAAGDFAIALLDYTAAVNLQLGLVKRDPANAYWLATLAPSYAGLGAAFEKNGDLTNALAQYEAELEIRQRLADKDPSNVGWQRGLQAVKDKIDGLKGKMTPPTGGPDQKP